MNQFMLLNMTVPLYGNIGFGCGYQQERALTHKWSEVQFYSLKVAKMEADHQMKAILTSKLGNFCRKSPASCLSKSGKFQIKNLFSKTIGKVVELRTD